MKPVTKPSADQILRRARFAPYRKGMGPTFSLTMWDTYRTVLASYGKSILGYKLVMREESTTMKVIQDDLWLCVDCMIVAVNDDPSGIDSEERIAEVYAGLAKLGPNLVPNFAGEGYEEFATCGCDACGSSLAGTMHRFAILAPAKRNKATTLFEGEDFSCGAGTAVDSNDAVRSLMSFLTLRPGDTDDEYFADYTPEQLAYCNAHAEALALEVMNRYGEEC